MTTNQKIAAIWCRVSTHDQRSYPLNPRRRVFGMPWKSWDTIPPPPPPQYVFKVDWTSLDLMRCPDFQRLRQWVLDGGIAAVGVLDRDRLQAQGLQRLIFLSECQEHNVQVITVQGPPMLEGAEGQLVELALAIGKEKSVLRAQQGAKGGIRDRVSTHVKKGIGERARKGLHLGGIPFGYASCKGASQQGRGPCEEEHPGSVHIVQQEAEAIRELFRRYATGTVTLSQLASWLNREGFRTRNMHRLQGASGDRAGGPPPLHRGIGARDTAQPLLHGEAQAPGPASAWLPRGRCLRGSLPCRPGDVAAQLRQE